MQQSELKLGVIGLGHVGLPTAVCFAEMGYQVLGTDQDATKLASLRKGRATIYEPGLQELLDKQLDTGMIQFVDDIASVMDEASVLFICVGTPQAEDGEPDLSQVEETVKDIARHLTDYKIIVEKSTVPVTTAAWIKRIISTHKEGPSEFDVASNPEFLREGTAISDFLNPDRIVLGVETERSRDMLKGLYASFDCPVFVTDLNTVEVIKHASNAFLAMRVSFINMVSDLCEASGADVVDVAQGMGLDPRIGQAYLEAGLGYGGYCLPKDVRGFIHIGEQLGVDFSLLKQVENINNARVGRLVEKLTTALGAVNGKQIGILGLSFKPDTDDTRESPSLKVIELLRDAGALLRLHDPQAMENTKQAYPIVTGSLEYCQSAYDAAAGSSALLILTAWSDYRELDFPRLHDLMATPVLVDGRNVLDADKARDIGFEYSSMGRI